MFATREAARKFEQLAARGLAIEAMLQQRILQEAVNDSVRAFRDLHECGIDVEEYVTGLRDAVSNADAKLMSTIDEFGLPEDPHAEHLDLAELDALIAKVKS